MVEIDDHSIIKKVLEGDTASFAEIVVRYQQIIFNLTYQMTGNEEDARDLTQEIFIRAYMNLDRIDPHYKFFSWLYRLGVNQTLDFIKRRKPLILTENLMAHDRYAENENGNLTEKKTYVRKAIQKLKPKYRLLIVMKYYSAFSYDQMSLITGIPEKKVKSRLFEARQMLRTTLKSSMEIL